jgi:hypothetical protein
MLSADCKLLSDKNPRLQTDSEYYKNCVKGIITRAISKSMIIDYFFIFLFFLKYAIIWSKWRLDIKA